MKNIFHVENLLKQQQHQSEIVQNHEKPIDLRLNKLKIAQSSSSQPISLQQQQQPETINNQQSNGIKIDDDDHDHEQVLFALNKLPTTRSRTLFSDWQLACLEWRFTRNKYLTSSDRRKVAQLLHLRQVQVKTWFQNRRMKWKRQILASGKTLKSPTKPKGRPKKNSIPPIDD